MPPGTRRPIGAKGVENAPGPHLHLPVCVEPAHLFQPHKNSVQSKSFNDP